LEDCGITPKPQPSNAYRKISADLRGAAAALISG
jgi:hypothetical protein